ncbi:HMG-Y-related protein [Drosera capensis]
MANTGAGAAARTCCLILDKLRDAVVSRLAAESLSAHQISLIERRIDNIVPVIRTPTHPAYSFMIYTAITELNEEEGSSQEAISEYIKRKFKDLPWAHERYLGHHLGQLCDAGEIVVCSGKGYSIPGLVQKRRGKGKGGRKRKREAWNNNGKGNSDGRGTGEGNVIEGSCSIEEDGGVKGSLVLREEKEDDVKRAEATPVNAKNGIEGCEALDLEMGAGVVGQEGATVVATESEQFHDIDLLEKCHDIVLPEEQCHDTLAEVCNLSEQCQPILTLGSSLPVNQPSLESAEEILPLVVDKLVEEQLPMLDQLATEEPPAEVSTEMPQLDHDGAPVLFAVMPYEGAIPEAVVMRNIKEINPSEEVVPLVVVDETIEEQLPMSDPLAIEEPSEEMQTKTLQMDMDTDHPTVCLAIAPYDGAIPDDKVKKNIKKINPIVNRYIVCGMAAEVPKQAQRTAKMSHRKKTHKSSVILLTTDSHDSATGRKLLQHGKKQGVSTLHGVDIENQKTPDSLSREKLSVEQLHQAEGSRKRKHAWRLEVDRDSKVLRFFQGSNSKPSVGEQRKVLEDSNSGNLCQHHLASESVPSQKLSSEQVEMQVIATSSGRELGVAAPPDKTFLSDEQCNEQQAKQTRKRKRKRKASPGDPADSAISLAPCSLFSQKPHELQNETKALAEEIQTPPVVISKMAGPMELVSPSDNVDTQQKNIQHEPWGEKLQSYQGQVHQSPALDPGQISISLQDLHVKENPKGQANPCDSELAEDASMEKILHPKSEVDIQELKQQSRYEEGSPSELERSGEANATESLHRTAQHLLLEEQQEEVPITASSEYVEPTTAADLPSSRQVHLSPQEKPERKRGRPRKLRNQHHKVPEHEGLGKPFKAKTKSVVAERISQNLDCHLLVGLPPQHQVDGHENPEAAPVCGVEGMLPSKRQVKESETHGHFKGKETADKKEEPRQTRGRHQKPKPPKCERVLPGRCQMMRRLRPR